MAMKQCANGHLYDDSKSAACPYCSGESAIGVTIPLGESAPPAQGGIGVTIPLGHVAPAGDTKSKDQMVTMVLDDAKNSEVSPVRAWLVVVDGEKLGLDFAIHTGKNTVGRGKSNDVCFDFDNTVSKENNVSIIYDDRNNVFYIQPGEGKNNVYVNNQLLLEYRQIKDYDTIEIGKTKLVFRTFCNELFNY